VVRVPAYYLGNRGPELLGEHHLNTVKLRADVQNENWLNSIARKRPTKTPCSLFAIDSPIPKLDVAGSNPVSRSIFSITWKDSFYPLHSICTAKLRRHAGLVLSRCGFTTISTS
jgi:hypothetical protein